MLSEEEKKAINYLEKEYKKLKEEGNILFPLYKQQAKTLLNLINKLQKENEELKRNGIQNLLDDELTSLINEYLGEKFKLLINHDYISKKSIKEKIYKINKILDETNDGDLLHELIVEREIYENLLKEGVKDE